MYKGINLLTGRDRDKFGWPTLNNCFITSYRTLYSYHSLRGSSNFYPPGSLTSPQLSRSPSCRFFLLADASIKNSSVFLQSECFPESQWSFPKRQTNSPETIPKIKGLSREHTEQNLEISNRFVNMDCEQQTPGRVAKVLFWIRKRRNIEVPGYIGRSGTVLGISEFAPYSGRRPT